MAFCHGQGSTDPGGCCYVAGAICPHHLNATQLTAYINSLGLTGVRKTRAQNMAQGVQHACGIAIRIIANDPAMILDRAAFNAAWTSHPDYVRDVRPAWAVVEQRTGMAPNTFNCSTWQGEAGKQCCYSETTTVNEAKATALHSTAVTVRRAGGA